MLSLERVAQSVADFVRLLELLLAGALLLLQILAGDIPLHDAAGGVLLELVGIPANLHQIPLVLLQGALEGLFLVGERALLVLACRLVFVDLLLEVRDLARVGSGQGDGGCVHRAEVQHVNAQAEDGDEHDAFQREENPRKDTLALLALALATIVVVHREICRHRGDTAPPVGRLVAVPVHDAEEDSPSFVACSLPAAERRPVGACARLF
mmetsp:Transcript_1948/g.6984  ORF Transcript_1948/g.6984 Transcript_1948/m.6984 type:complete len:210 (-) Transcript_1948:85-714(-)